MVTLAPEEMLQQVLSSLILPSKDSHKGQNGRLLIIGGSTMFHAASLWAAGAASRVVDMVHYSSTVENEQIFLNLKSKFADGIVIHKDQLLNYVEEDDCILIGPGMERGEVSSYVMKDTLSFEEIMVLTEEADYTYALIKFLIHTYPQKKFVFDAAALQMMDVAWLSQLKTKPILTPHCREFDILFDTSICEIPLEEKKNIVVSKSREYSSTILFKQIADIISDGEKTCTITGGNAGLAKGGTGDVLAGLAAAFYTTNDAFNASVIASYLVKKTAEDMFKTAGLMYNTSDLLEKIPLTAKGVLFDN